MHCEVCCVSHVASIRHHTTRDVYFFVNPLILLLFPLLLMKKVSLLLSTLGGAMAGYLFSKKELREQLAEADTAEEAAKVLGHHLQRDGKALAKHVQEFVNSDDVQKNLAKAKKFAMAKATEARTELKKLVDAGSKKLEKRFSSKKITKAVAKKRR